MKKSVIRKISIICTILCVFLSCERDSEIVFSPTGVPVDLGLTVNWASCNIGANSAEEYGNYFAWGEVRPKNRYVWLAKYYPTYKVSLPPHADAATVNWGSTWHIPTDAEWTELCEQCTWRWTTQNGINGYRVTSKSNGNSIFLPAAGYRYDNSLYDAGSYGNYWSSSRKTDAPDVYFESRGVWRRYHNRYYGLSVRPVCP